MTLQLPPPGYGNNLPKVWRYILYYPWKISDSVNATMASIHPLRTRYTFSSVDREVFNIHFVSREKCSTVQPRWETEGAAMFRLTPMILNYPSFILSCAAPWHTVCHWQKTRGILCWIWPMKDQCASKLHCKIHTVLLPQGRKINRSHAIFCLFLKTKIYPCFHIEEMKID